MKVLHIGKYYFPFFGGIEKVTQDLVENRVYQNKVTSFILAHQNESKLPSEHIKINDIQVCKVRLNGVVAYAPIATSFLKELNQVVDEFNPDVIHIHMPNLSAFACLFSSRAKKVPWVVHWHSDVLGAVPDLKIKLLYPFYRLFERSLLKRACRVLVTSPPYLTDSAALNDFKHKCSVVPIGIKDVGLCANNQDTQTTNQLNLLMIGRLTYYKGHSLMLRALSRLPAKIKVHLSIIGEGELSNELLSLSKSLKIQDKVSFLGRVSDSDISKQLFGTDLLCLPSIEKTEAFGVVLLEAAMHSKPALVSNVKGSGMSWVVQDRVTGFIFENNNVESLCEKIQEIYLDKMSLKALGLNARERFDEVFNLDSVANQITELYENILAEKTMLDS
ncbi:glycosyltransferase [Pseudoalteromonas sp.]|uniref:glycosyltransferase n=1 Tax=Pseudoalteromonas sp. TaxID=53249 RepID=UPI00356A13B3